MKKLLAYIIRKRNPNFTFDPNLSTYSLLQFILIQIVRIIRGCKTLLFLSDPKWMLRSEGVTFFNIYGIKWWKLLKVGKYTHLSGLGEHGLQMGDHVSIGAFSRLIVSTTLNDTGEGILIGNNVGMGEYAYLEGAGGLEIGDNCIIGQYFSFHPENHNYTDPTTLIRLQGTSRKGIKIGQDCWIGSKVTITDGVNIGKHCVIAGGSVVTKSFPDHVIIGGVPARIIKHI